MRKHISSHYTLTPHCVCLEHVWLDVNDCRGISFDRSGDFDAAIADFKVAISISPNADFYHNLGFCYRWGRVGEAHDIFDLSVDVARQVALHYYFITFLVSLTLTASAESKATLIEP